MTSFSRRGYLQPPIRGGLLPPSRLDELKKRFEENPRRFFAPLANEYRKTGDLEQAIALCQEHLQGQPGNMNGQVVYGQALFDAGRYADAETTFTTALSLDPENLIALRHLGDIARLTGNTGGAMDWYKRVLDADPRNEEILAFIDELKATAPAAPPPPEPEPVQAAGTPTPFAPLAAVSAREAPTVEFTPPAAARVTVPTPAAAVPPEVAPPASRQSEPKRRASLVDLDLDLAATAMAAAEPPAPPPSAPEVPTGDIELGSLDFGMAAPEAPEAHAEVPAVDVPVAEAPAAEAPALDVSLGWDMGGNVELPPTDAGAGTADSGAAAAPEPPHVFVTETMAELYLQQGFRDEALQVYRQLAEQNPHDESIRGRIRALESGGRSSMTFEKLADETPDLAPGTESLIVMPDAETAPEAAPEAAPEGAPAAGAAAGTVPIESLALDEVPAAPHEEVAAVVAAAVEPTPTPEPAPAMAPPAAPRAATARAFFAGLAQRRALRPDGTLPEGMPAVPTPAPAASAVQGGGSLDALFGAAPSDADDAIGQALATAVGLIDGGATVRGRPTQAAASELSLDSVFRSDSAFRSSGPVQRQSEVLKFDQFFAPEPESSPAPDAPAPDVAPGAPAPADDAQFQSWLQGLKKT